MTFIKESYKLWISGLFDFNSDEPLYKYNRIKKVQEWTFVPIIVIPFLILMAYGLDHDVNFDMINIFLPIIMISWFAILSSEVRRLKFRGKKYHAYIVVTIISYIMIFVFNYFANAHPLFGLFIICLIFLPYYFIYGNDEKIDRDELFEKVEKHEWNKTR